MAEDKRVPTQFIDLKSEDFGPRQEQEGARLQKVGKPPPTEFIPIPQRVRKDSDVLADLTRQRSLAGVSRRIAKGAVSIALATWDVVREVSRQRNGNVGKSITLMHDEPLRLRADDRAPFTLKLKAGTTIIVYPEIDAPAGWLAARAPGGELGYVSAERVLS
jgi:hypothetical protein